MDLMNLVATLSLDSKNFVDGLTNAKSQASGLSAASVAIGNLITQGFNTAVGAVKNFAGSVMDSGMSFESTMSEVKAISGATGEDFDKLTAKAQEMGSKTKFSATESAEAFTYMAMAGWKTGDMLDGIEGIMSLAAASGEDLATTSDIVTDALTAFGLQASDSAHFSDILAAASSNANTNVSLMGESFKYVAPVAGALKYNAEDVSVALGLMANAGIKSSSAGTTLRHMLVNLSKPTDQVQAAMNALNLSFTDSQGQVKPLSVLLEEMRDRFSTLSDAEKAQYASTLAGQTGMSGLLAIVNASNEDYQKLTKAIYECDGASASMADTMQQNLKGAIVILKSGLEGLALAFYEGIKGTATDAVKGLTEAVSMMTEKVRAWIQSDQTQERIQAIAGKVQLLIDKLINNLDPILDGIIGLFDKLVDVAGFVIDNFDSIATVVSTVVTAFGAFKAVMAVLNIAGFLTSPVGLAVAAIGGLIAILSQAGVTMDTVKGVFTTAWEAIKSVWQAVQPFFSTLFNNIKNIFSAGATTLSGFMKKAWEEVKSVWNLAKPLFETIINGIKAIFNAGAPFLSAAFKSAWEAIKAVWNVATSFFSVVWNGIKTIFAVVKGVLTGDFSDAWEGIKGIWNAAGAFFASIWSAIQTVFSAVPNIISGFFRSAWQLVQTAWSAAVGFFQNIISGIQQVFSGIAGTVGGYFTQAWGAVQSAWSGVGNFFSGVVETISGAFSGLVSKASQWGSDMINGFKQGIERAKGALKTAANNVAGMIKGIFHFSRPDEGPLRDYESWMPDFVKGMAKGLEDNAWRLKDASAELAGAMAQNVLPVSSPAVAGNTSNCQISINIDGAKYNDEQSLAEAISYELQNLMDRRRAVFA